MRKFVLVLLIIIATNCGNAEAKNKPATFKKGNETLLLADVVPASGDVVKVDIGNSYIAEFKIPAGAFGQNTKVEIYKANVNLKLNSGEPSGLYLRLKSPVNSFAEPVTIVFNYDAEKWKGYIPFAYALDDDNELSALSPGQLDRDAGRAEFSTFVPLLFTVIFIK